MLSVKFGELACLYSSGFLYKHPQEFGYVIHYCLLLVLHTGISWRRLDGKMNSEQRERSITDFKNPQKDIQVFLISIKAGGVGITLTDATQVFLLDPWWNPAIEDQAIDRVHRLGQTKKVTVYRFNAKTDRVDDPAPTGNEKEHHYKSIEWKVRNIVHQFKRELQQELVEGRREKAEESLYDQLIY